MSHRLRVAAAACLVLVGLGVALFNQPIIAKAKTESVAPAPRKLTIVWTSGDPEVAHRMVLMYAHAAKKSSWFDEVRVIVWGPSSRLTAADKEIQVKLTAMKADGVVLEACVVCANSYGVTDRLRDLGIDVKPMGKPLSDLVQDSSTHMLTF